jgi:hypothetical protein
MNEVAMNVTTAISGLSDIPSWFGLITLFGLMAIILSVLIIGLSGIKGFKRVKRLLLWFAKTIRYFGYGILTIAYLGIPIYLIYLLEQQAVEGNYVPIKWVGYVVGGYAVICLIGFIAKKVVDRFKKLNKITNKNKKIK